MEVQQKVVGQERLVNKMETAIRWSKGQDPFSFGARYQVQTPLRDKAIISSKNDTLV